MKTEYIIIAFLILTVILVIFYFRNRLLNQHATERYSFLDEMDERELQDFQLAFKQKEIDDLFLNFNNSEDELSAVLEEIRVLFEIEYVSIGLISYYDLEDIVVSNETPFKLKKNKHKKLSKSKSYVFTECLKNLKVNDVHIDNQIDIKDSLNNIGIEAVKAFDSYEKDIIPSGEIRNMLVKGIYDKKENLIGYFHLINKFSNDFDSDDKTFINRISENFSRSFENFILERNKKKDAKEILKWYKIHNNNKLIDRVLGYLNTEFHLLYSTFNIKTVNGFSNSTNKIHIPNYITNQSLDKLKTTKLESFINTNRFYDFNESVLEFIESNKGNKDNIYIEQGVNSSSLVGDSSIYIPIIHNHNNIDSLIELNFEYEIFNKKRFKKRIKYLIDHFKVLYEKNLYNETYKQINKLSNFLINAEIKFTEDNYFDSICRFIKESIDSQSCSIFLKTFDESDLFLRATTTSSFLNKREGVKLDSKTIDEMISNETPVYNLLSVDSITSRVFDEKRNVLIYDIFSSEIKDTNTSFMEITDTTHKSLIAIPILGKNKPIGVIRCVNNNKTHQHIFEQRDLKILTLLTNIISNQIELNEFNKYRNNALSEFGHENKSPLDACYTNLHIFELDFKNLFRNKELPKHLEERLDYFKDNFKVLENNINNFSRILSENKEGKVVLNYKKIDILGLISSNSKVFKYTDKKIIFTKNNNYTELKLFLDQPSISQVIYNLLSNAERYADKSSIIKIELDDSQPNHFHFNFINFGIGVNDKDRERIFNQYYRSTKAKEVSSAGSGIGLYVSRKNAQQHDGNVIVSKLDSPTIFTLKLPKYLTNKKPFSV